MAGDRAGDNGVGPVAVGKNGEWLGDGDEAAMPIPGPLLTGADGAGAEEEPAGLDAESGERSANKASFCFAWAAGAPPGPLEP